MTRTVPAYTIQMFTGNNVSPRGDTASRSLMTRLEVDRPDPENRKFTHSDPIAWTLEHRGKILQALYTILIGNEQLKPGRARERKTRFKLWWNLVGSAVENAAAALIGAEAYKPAEKRTAVAIDFGAIFAAVEAEDEDTGGVADVLDILNRRWPTYAFQASDIALFLGSGGPIQDDDSQDDDSKILLNFFDPTGRRGGEIRSIVIGKRLKTILGAPVFVGDKLMTLILKQEGGGVGKRAVFYQIRVAATGS